MLLSYSVRSLILQGILDWISLHTRDCEEVEVTFDIYAQLYKQMRRARPQIPEIGKNAFHSIVDDSFYILHVSDMLEVDNITALSRSAVAGRSYNGYPVFKSPRKVCLISEDVDFEFVLQMLMRLDEQDVDARTFRKLPVIGDSLRPVIH